MSDTKRVQVEFTAEVDPSVDSSSEHVRKSLRETSAEYGKMAAETAASLAVAAAAHQSKISVIRAGWAMVTTAARQGAAAVVSVAPQVLSGLGVITGGVIVLRGAMKLLRAASNEVGVGLNSLAEKENLVSKLQPLTGSLEAAKAKLKELAATFRGTTFRLPDIIDAYRSSEVQTGGALSDQKGLTLIGDLAAKSGNSLRDTGDAVSKFYGDLQAGAPIEESTQKLRDMGIVSAEVVQHIFALQKEGKSGAEVWSYLSSQFDKSSGAAKAAADNLDTLQRALADSKNKLRELFAEASANGTTSKGDDGIKSEIRQQIAALEALQPAAKEAGGLYAMLRSLLSDTRKGWIEITQAILQHTQATNQNTPAVAKNADSILNHIGSLVRWVDVLFVAGSALAALIPVALVGGAAITVLGTAIAGTVAIFGLVAAGFTALAAGMIVYINHANEADKKLVSIIESNRAMLTGLRSQEQGIKSVTDKILALAKAYQVLDAAQQQQRKAKTPGERQEADNFVKRTRLAIQRIEARDDEELDPSEAREKSEAVTDEAQEKIDDLKRNPKQKLDLAVSSLDDARKKQAELRTKLSQVQGESADGGAASDEVIDRQIHEARQRIKDSRRRERVSAFLPEGFRVDPGEERGIRSGEDQKIQELEAFRRGRVQRIETARTELAAQDAVVTTASKEVESKRKASEEYDAKVRQFAIEEQIANLGVEGLARAREEWQIKREGLQADLAVARQGTDATKTGEIEAKIAQGNAALRKQEEAAEQRKRELEIERDILSLKTEGAQRASDEWSIRLAGLQKELEAAQAKGDDTKAGEITSKIAQGNAALVKAVQADANSSREIEAEAKIADLQGEGIERARQESDIRLGLIEARWREAMLAKDATVADKARLDYIKEQAAQHKREADERQNEGRETRSLEDAKAQRQDDADKRQLEQNAREGRITEQQRREGLAAILERQRSRLQEAANQKIQEANDADGAGERATAARLEREAAELRARSDALGGEQYGLLHPEQRQNRSPITDELRKIGGGGSAYYGTGTKDTSERQLEKSNQLLDKIEKHLDRANRGDPRLRVL